MLPSGLTASPPTKLSLTAELGYSQSSLGRADWARLGQRDPRRYWLYRAWALDRQEMATEDGRDVPYSAVQYVQHQLGLEVAAIAKLEDLMHYLAKRSSGASADDHLRVLAYRERYGVDEG